MHFQIKDIAQLLQGEIVGDEEAVVESLSKIQEAEAGSISFLANPKYESFIYITRATGVLVSRDFTPSRPVQTILIRVDDPYLSFSILLDTYYKAASRLKTGIEQPSFIGLNSVAGENVYRGAFSYIGDYVKIGKNVKIYPQSYVGDNVTIGDDTIIRPGVKLYENTILGNNCVLHSGVVVGSDGFGFAPQADGSYKKIMQSGNVIIEDNVEIGSNTVIDCATMGSTIIRQGVKLDNLIQIAHNVEIGDHTVMAAQSGVSGSTKIGKYCVIGGMVGVVGHIEIADRVKVGAQSGVSRAIKEPGSVVLGSPAFDRDDCAKSYVIFKKLPDLMNRIRELEKKMVNYQEG